MLTRCPPRSHAPALTALALLAAVAAHAQGITVLRSFNSAAEGGTPSSNLLLGTDGLLYGLLADGGAGSNGAIYRIAPDGTGYSTIFSFPAGGTAPGSPSGHNGAWLQGRDGAFYGVTNRGGTAPAPAFGQGTLFKINGDGTGFTVLRTFTGIANRDGGLPRGGLIQASDGLLYGTTFNGSGTSTFIGDTSGTIYRIAPDGTGYQVIFSFNTTPNGLYGNGRAPTALLQGRDGRLYGTTREGGTIGSIAFSNGAIFTLRTDGTGFALLRTFAGTGSPGGDGRVPDSPLVQDADGVLYGTTIFGGVTNAGTIYRINPDGSDYRIIYSFTNTTDGNSPNGVLFLGADGTLYGSTGGGATNNRGATYRVNRDGSGFRVLDTHPQIAPTGTSQYYGLAQARDGAFYGGYSTAAGTTLGQIFRLSVPSTPVITQQPVSQTVAPGGSVTFTVTANDAATYQWQRNGTNIAAATAATLTLSNLTGANDGTYTVLVGNANGTTLSAGALLLVTATPPQGRLINLSILTQLAGAADSFTMGYVVGGAGTSGAKPLVIRAAGPSLTPLGVGGALADPRMEFFTGAVKSGENDNWGGAADLTAAMAGVGAFAYAGPTTRDAAALASAAAGNNSVVVSPVGNLSGTVLAEIYDASPAATFTATTPRLINVSVLKGLGTGLTAGFVIGGNAARTVLIRAIGPTLGAAPFNVPGTVADPQLTLFAGSAQIGANDNWGGTAPLTAAFGQIGAFALPAASRDAALLVTLAPGQYTAQVAGVGGTTGVALVEIYEVP